MSHIVNIQTQVRDAEAVQSACRRLGLPAAVQGTAKLFTQTVTQTVSELGLTSLGSAFGMQYSSPPSKSVDTAAPVVVWQRRGCRLVTQ